MIFKSSFSRKCLEDVGAAFFTGRMPFPMPNQQCQSIEGKLPSLENGIVVFAGAFSRLKLFSQLIGTLS